MINIQAYGNHTSTCRFEKVISIIDCMMYHVGKGVKPTNAVSKTYPFTKNAIIVKGHVCQHSA